MEKPILILCIGAAEKFGWKYNLFNGSLKMPKCIL